MGTWQSQATHSTQLTQNTADITLHRLFALRQCKLLLRAATPCGLGPTGHMTPSRTHCSHILSAQTQAGARAHVLLRRTPVASEGYRDSASNTTLRRRLHQALDTTRCTALLNTLTRSIRPVTRSSPHSSARSPIGFHTPPPPLTRRTYGRMPSPHGIHMPSPYGFPLPSPATHSKTTLQGSVYPNRVHMYCSRQHLNLITKPHSSILQTATSSPTFRPLTTRGRTGSSSRPRTGPESAKTHLPLAPHGISSISPLA